MLAQIMSLQLYLIWVMQRSSLCCSVSIKEYFILPNSLCIVTIITSHLSCLNIQGALILQGSVHSAFVLQDLSLHWNWVLN